MAAVNPALLLKLAAFAKKKWKPLLIILVSILLLCLMGTAPILFFGVTLSPENTVDDHKKVAEDSGIYWPDLLLYHAIYLNNNFAGITEKEIIEAARRLVKYRFYVTTITNGKSHTDIQEYSFEDFYNLLQKKYKVELESMEETKIPDLAAVVEEIDYPGEDVRVEIIYLSITDPEIWNTLTPEQQELYAALSLTFPYQFGLERPPGTGDGGSDEDIKNPPPVEDSPFIWPVPTIGRITSGFGERLDPFTNQKDNHTGLDISSPGDGDIGTDVVASGDGTVYAIVKDASAACGWNIRIRHGNTAFQTRYCHLSKIHVELNEEVDAGDVIGEIGKTGRTDGAHLHFEMKRNGVLVDPLPYIVSTRP